MHIETWPKGLLHELPEDESWAVLRGHKVGRLCWSGPQRPHIVPVNFAEHEQRIWIRTTPYSQLARECPGHPVAFEVDDIDDFTRSGVSVVAEGVAEHRTARELTDLAPDLEAWPDGQRSLVLCIEVSTITGRRLLPS